MKNALLILLVVPVIIFGQAQESEALLSEIKSYQSEIDSLSLEMDKLEQQIDRFKNLKIATEEKLRLSSVKGVNNGSGINVIARVKNDLGPFQIKDVPWGKNIGQAPINSQITVFLKEDNFYKITYKNITGYIVSSYLQLEPSVKRLFEISTPKNKTRNYGTTNSKSTRSSSSSSGRVIHTGPRGGRYYINKNGNKTYVKRKN